VIVIKRIAILMLHLQHGGIEKQTITLANELSKKYEVEIISTYSMNCPPAYEINDRVKVTYLMDAHPNRKEIADAIKSKNIFKIAKEGFCALKILYLKKKLMQKAIKKLDCDFVLSTRVEYAEMLSACAPKGITTITQEHLHDDSKEYVARCQKAFRNLDYLAVICQGSEDNFARWLKDNEKIKIVRIPNILEAVPDKNAALQGNNLVTAGRLHPVKNFAGLIKVFALVAKQVPNATLTIVGGGEEEHSLASLVEELGLQDKVEFTGMVSKQEVEEHMLASDLFVMTSLTECFPMVLLEASSVGLPLISYDVPVGPKAIITQGENGYLVPFEDKEQMAEKIVKILKDNNLKAQLAKGSKANSYNYLPQNIVPMWEEIFDR